MSETLSAGELLDVTGTPQKHRQISVLRAWGIDPKEKADGSLMVTWAAIRSVHEMDEADLPGVDRDNKLVRMVVGP